LNPILKGPYIALFIAPILAIDPRYVISAGWAVSLRLIIRRDPTNIRYRCFMDAYYNWQLSLIRTLDNK
jgi:hypothetical protein